MELIHRISITGILLLFSAVSALAFANGAPQGKTSSSAPALPEDQVFALKIPVFSPLFSATPVAAVDDRSISLDKLTPALQESRFDMSRHSAGTALTKRFNEVLGGLVDELLQGKEKEDVVIYAEGNIGEDRTLTLNVPIFSSRFLFTPVASVNEIPIPMGEFTRDLSSMHENRGEEGGAEGHHHETPESLLDRLVTVRLVEQEARNIGFDQTDSFKKQVEAFAEKTLLYELLGRQIESMELDREEADAVYRDISLEAKLRSYRFGKQEDAVAFMEQLEEEGADFAALIQQQIDKGKASGGEDEDYVPLKELRSKVASAAEKMEIGEVSEIFQVGDGFVMFKLEDRRFMEDPAALQVAEKITWDRQVARKTREYVEEIIERYATFNEQARDDFSFAAIKEENPEAKLSEALQGFLDDQRILATVEGGDETHTMKVSELADRLESSYFHGTDVALNASEADDDAEGILEDWIFRIAGKVEAGELGLDQSRRYQLKVEEFERRALFDNFIQKAIVNDIKLTEEEIRAYYDSHQDEYSTPTMVRMKSLVFHDEEKARDAWKKLKGGSDFRWVSANSEGLVQAGAKDVLDFEKGILSLTSLPPELQKNSEGVQSGDSLVYSDPDKFHYVIYFDKVFPPEPKPYDQVRSGILKKVFQARVQDALSDYVEKLKEHYPTEIYLSFKEIQET